MSKHTEQKEQIVICKECNKPEYSDKMWWLEGRFLCRRCYRSRWEQLNQRKYKWDDLDGSKPTVEEYEQQKAAGINNQNERYF